jgi:hypothetical protein
MANSRWRIMAWLFFVPLYVANNWRCCSASRGIIPSMRSA